MNPFILGIVILILLVLGARAFIAFDPARLAHYLRILAASFGMLAGTLLLLSGRVGLALMLLGATVVAFRVLGGGVAPGSWTRQGPSPSQGTSTIRTATLSMALDHTTGDLEGEVLAGPLAGRQLGSLNQADLLSLLDLCTRQDPRSVPLLETYLDRRQPGWREDLQEEGKAYQSFEAKDGDPATMDDATARLILGVGPEATEEDIKAAHRQLMTKFHPDHGGTSYLAAQINRAKDFLLQHRP